MLIAVGRADVRHPPRPLIARLAAIVTQRCPVCLEGALFQSRWRLHDKCSACGHLHVQPAGFAKVAMVAVCTVPTVAAAVAAFVIFVRLAAVALPQQIGVEPAVLAALSFQYVLVPGVSRTMRALWEHLRLPTQR